MSRSIYFMSYGVFLVFLIVFIGDVFLIWSFWGIFWMSFCSKRVVGIVICFFLKRGSN